MKVAFRADASLKIGSGHVMRCLTLADALRAQGADCSFICREHPGNLLPQIQARGHAVHALPLGCPDIATTGTDPAHYGWLGTAWQADATQTLGALKSIRPDWLIVDHYALDHRWETAVRPACTHLLAMDDLADREHACDLLLDQNLGRAPADYSGLVPATCLILAGPRYALLKPEFAQLREHSLARRAASASIGRVLVTMGGIDQDNATGSVLQTLQDSNGLPADCRITVVMGAQAPWRESVQAQTRNLPWPVEIAINVNDMARRMADSDLAIGAAGGTAWERCCLGLPTLLVVLAENQWPGARALAAEQAVRLIGETADIARRLGPELATLRQSDALQRMSRRAGAVTDGLGVNRLSEILKNHGKH